MDSENEKRHPLWKHLLVFLLAFSTWMIGLASIDGGFHRFAHGGTDCEPNGLVCAIALFGAGAVATAPNDVVVSLPPDAFSAPLAADVFVSPKTPSVGTPQARAPPHLLIQL